MKIKKIEYSPITLDDLEKYKSLVSKLKGFLFTANDVGIDKRIITIRTSSPDDISSEITMVNPTIISVSDKQIVYFELDFLKNKIRKTIRYTYLLVNTDNMGKIEFKADNEKLKWDKDVNHMLSDKGLSECVMVQRAIDAINGISIMHKTRRYTTTIESKPKISRNQKVMLRNSSGDTVFVKYKKINDYIERGYVKV
jgi:hypothetical protein